MHYKDQKINLFADIGFFIISLVSLFSLSCVFIEFLNGNFGIEVLLLVSLLFLSVASCFSYIGLMNIINAKYNRKIAKKIIDNGIKVSGEIIGFETEYNYNNSLFKRAFFRTKRVRLGGGDVSIYNYAKVKYSYNRQTYIIDTPYVDFYLNDLIEKDVDVYIYNDVCYVNNFKINSKKIFDENEKWKNTVLSTIIPFFIIGLVMAIVIYLNIIKILDTKYIPIIVISLMASYVLYVLICELRKYK